MRKTVFIVTGYQQKVSHPDFKWMRPHFLRMGYEVRVFAPHWERRVMTDYVADFTDFYGQHKGIHNTVLGFSFGAMIALISAPVLKPNVLVLCSLSPYFKEDLRHLTPSMMRMIGKRRYNDFARYSAKKITSSIRPFTSYVFCGDVEARKYPQMKKRCVDAHRNMENSTLLQVAGAPHKINHPEYVRAIKAIM